MTEERSIRSVFVGNIPYEASEEQLKKIFNQVGPVVSFRLVYDRETGKPKGYGFCEYQDQETAQVAMKNLNNHDFNGRPLRVGVAAGDQAKDDPKVMQQMFGPMSESPYGEPMDPEKAPEAISKVMASLPPEQMYELMKQMQLCIKNNPNEARNMLLQNPQIAYALLQAQVVMRITDPQVAMAMLYRPMEQIPPVLPSNAPSQPTNEIPVQKPVYDQLSPGQQEFGGGRGASNLQRSRGGLLGDMPPQGSRLMAPPFPGDSRDVTGIPARPEMSMGDARINSPMYGSRNENRENQGMRRPEPMDERRDMRPADVGGMNKRPPHAEPSAPRGPNIGPPIRGGAMRDMGGPRQVDPRFGEDRYRENRGPDNMGPRGFRSPVYEESGRGFESNYRGDNMRGPDSNMRRHAGPMQQGPESMDTDLRARPTPSFPQNPGGATPRPSQDSPREQNVSVQDQEKAALIIQVLQLSDEQIALLPPEQRQSILILKEQIAKSSN